MIGLPLLTGNQMSCKTKRKVATEIGHDYSEPGCTYLSGRPNRFETGIVGVLSPRNGVRDGNPVPPLSNT